METTAEGVDDGRLVREAVVDLHVVKWAAATSQLTVLSAKTHMPELITERTCFCIKEVTVSQ